MKRQFLHGLTLVLLAVGAGGCGGSGGAGDQEKAALPVAWAKALNQPYSGTGGNIRLTVRSGAEVFVSGGDSNGPSVPVIKFKWSVSQAPAGVPVALLKRNESTVSFRAPAATQQLTLQLKLVVTDSYGATDDAIVDVTVVPVADPDAFLMYGSGTQTYTLAAVTNVPAALTSNVRFDIAIERRVSYTDLAGMRHENFVLDTQTLSGAWLAATGTGGTGADCGDPQNPRFTLPLPALNADDILARLTDEQMQMALDPALIDEAEVTVKYTLTPLDALPQGVQAGVCVVGVATPLTTANAKPTQAIASFATSGNGGGVEQILTLDQLLGEATTTRDTRESAEAYYRTIDPDTSVYGAKRTFSGWLKTNGFTNGTTDWAAVRAGSNAHAVYLNNYDLGFGRDMYMRVGKCDGNATPSLGGTIETSLRGLCDVYGVVINYASLEAAAKNLAPVLAVAMEYSRVGDSGPRITKFYTYAPDRQGDFKRVLSANLDGRGEKFLPGVCTVCHGGTPQGVEALDADGDGNADRYGNGGSVNAGFLSWDLDSFLYSDTDPSFSKASDPFFPKSEQDLAAAYTRSAQAAELRKLNQLAYLTFADPPGQADRFKLARELVEGWYGGAGMPASSFNGEFIPDQWRNGVNGNPADAEKIYKEVFARNCRACHILHETGDKPNQLVIGSYADLFLDASTLAKMRDALSDGRMPFARLTMDRFWVGGTGAESASNVLANHLLQPANGGQSFTTPGALKVCIDPDIAGSKTLDIANRQDWVGLTAGCSRSIGQYAWTLSGPSGSSSVLVGGATATPTFLPDREGDYTITLASGGEADTLTATLADAKPVVDSGAIVVPITLVGGTGSGTADLDGQYSSRDAVTAVIVKSTSNVTAVTPTVTQVPNQASQVSIRITTNTLKAGFVRFALVDTDGDESNVVQIDTLPSASAPAAQLLAFELDANSTGTVNLWPGAAPLLAQVYGVTSAPILPGANGQFGTTNPAAGAPLAASAAVAYTAPRGIATHFGGLNLRDSAGVALRERFEYRVCYQDNTANCSANRVDVKLNATQALAALATQLRSSCSGCHADTRVGSNLVIKANAADQPDEKLRCTIVGGTSAAGNSAYPESLGTEPEGQSYLTLSGGAAGSLLFQKANGQLNHHGDGLTNAAWPLAAIQAWINEGALDTANGDPACTAGGSTGSATVPPSSSSSTVMIRWVDQSKTVDVISLGWQNPKGIVVKGVTSPGLQAQAVGASEITVTLNTDLRGGTVTYAVLGSDGKEAGTGTLVVEADADMTLSTPNFTRLQNFAANLQFSADILAASTMSPIAGLDAVCTITAFTPALTGNPATIPADKGVLTASQANGCTVTYDAPGGTISHFSGTQINAPDSFTYRVCWAGRTTGNECATGSGTFRINGTVSFVASVNSTLTTVCTDCHVGTAPSGDMSFGDLSSVGEPLPYGAQANFATVRGGVGRVVQGAPGSSKLYLYPSASPYPPGSPDPSPHTEQGTPDGREAIRKWIEQGAYCTGCTP